MKKQLWLVLLALSIIAIACGGGKQPAEEAGTFDEAQIEAQEAAYRMMMDVHDEVMPKMGEMNQLSQDLKAQMENVEDEATKASIEEVRQALEAAHDGMMEWMQGMPRVAQLRDSLSHAAIMDILQAEMPKVNQVKADILGSIEKAQVLLAELQDGE